VSSCYSRLGERSRFSPFSTCNSSFNKTYTRTKHLHTTSNIIQAPKTQE